MMMVVVAAVGLLLLLQLRKRVLRVWQIVGLQVFADLLERLRKRPVALRHRR
jgi:hypothetical protein